MRVALVGCGNIADRYAQAITAAPRLSLTGATDLEPARAERLVEAYDGARVFATLDELLGIRRSTPSSISRSHMPTLRSAVPRSRRASTFTPRSRSR